MLNAPGIAGDESGGGGGGTTTQSGNIAQALGFITEFNENVAIFNTISGVILENSILLSLITPQVSANTLTTRNNRQNLDALASIVSRMSNTGASSDDGYSSDQPEMIGPGPQPI